MSRTNVSVMEQSVSLEREISNISLHKRTEVDPISELPIITYLNILKVNAGAICLF